MSSELDKAKGLLKILEKSEQVVRLFNKIYEERAEVYKSLSKRFSLSNKPALIERLKILNGRERKILSILRENKDVVLPELALAQDNVKGLKMLKIVVPYFDKILDEQEKFLDDELCVIEGTKKWKDILVEFQEFFALLEDFKNNAKNCNKNFFSPKDLADSLENHKGLLPKEMKEIVLFSSVFVLIFEATIIAWDSWSQIKLFDPSKIIPMTELIKYIVIASALSYLNLPVTVFTAIKSQFKTISDSLLNLAETA
ncbi:hypothetical protein HZA97_04770 [Candidatus Woesearchaeota archaeon]|nr:hypothetical protein [Candidatus Woesearchaeota archaeon]